MDVVLGGKYRAIRQLGSGGMGTVYEALAPDGARVAVKVLHENASETVLARFKREAQAASGLDHPNIVRVVDFSADPSFLVMELLEGEALAVVVDREGSISASRAAHVGVQLLDALAAAHRAGIVHRDVKPANVMLCPSPSQDFVKLVDFGIAKVPDFSTKLTRTGNPVGRSPRWRPSSSSISTSTGAPTSTRSARRCTTPSRGGIRSPSPTRRS